MRIAPVTRGLALVDEIEDDAGDLTVDDEMFEVPSDQFAGAAPPSDDEHHLVDERGEDAGVDHRADRRQVDDDIIVESRTNVRRVASCDPTPRGRGDGRFRTGWQDGDAGDGDDRLLEGDGAGEMVGEAGLFREAEEFVRRKGGGDRRR